MEGRDLTGKRIAAAIDYIARLFAGNSGGHDADHTLRVYRTAMQIADACPGCDREIVALAALLHDADDHKLFATRDFANARSFLREEGVPEDRIDRICRSIGEVSFSRNRGKTPSSLEAMIVQDADRLDAIGAIGIARTFAFGGEHGRPLSSSIDHFHEKLLLLKGEMHTDRARALAEERHRFMEDFLEEYRREMESEA